MPKILKIKRVAIGDKLRFEVFKRDKFMCQYCGQKAPDVVLNVDHIKPVADGGNNGLLNLVTSCRGCNSGKSDRLLDDASAVSTSRAQADTLQERRQQIQMLADWHIGLECCEPEIDAVNALLTKLANVSVSTDGCRANARKLIKQYGLSEVMHSITTAYNQYSREEAWGKIPAILRWRKVEQENPKLHACLKELSSATCRLNRHPQYYGECARLITKWCDISIVKFDVNVLYIIGECKSVARTMYQMREAFTKWDAEVEKVTASMDQK